MNEPAYLVGRLLGLSDKLHVAYCQAVRKEIPSTIIGNSLLSSALDNPVAALAVLADRLRIYIGWAKTLEWAKAGSEQDVIAFRTGRRALTEFADVERALGGRLPETKPTDEMKALMLLGYLARSERDPRAEEARDEEETENGN